MMNLIISNWTKSVNINFFVASAQLYPFHFSFQIQFTKTKKLLHNQTLTAMFNKQLKITKSEPLI